MHHDPDLMDNEKTIEELVAAGYIEKNSREHGVARQWANDGYDSLSGKQRTVFDNSLGKLMRDTQCPICDDGVPFNELPAALEEGSSLCGYHRHISMKND